MVDEWRLLTRIVPCSNGCWLWEGADSGVKGRGRGYGKIKIKGKTYYVHRIAYMIFVGPLTRRHQVDHECNNRRCIRPEHLKRVTHKRNQKLRADRARLTK